MEKRLGVKVILLVVVCSVIGLVTWIGLFSGSKLPKEQTVATTDNQQTNSSEPKNSSVETKTTWGEFLAGYVKDNPNVKFYNPNPQIPTGHEIRVVKTEYPNGLESKAGFYPYATVISVFDMKTGNILTSIGEYREESPSLQ
jgi:hypothetical protein